MSAITAFDEDLNAAADEECGYTALHYAAKYNDTSSLESLLSEGANVNITNSAGQTPLYVGCDEGHLPVVKALVENGGNVFLENDQGKAPIDKAIQGGNRELIEYMTSYDVLKTGFGKDVDTALSKNGRRALHYAALVQNISSLERLLSEGANVNTKNNYGETPLHVACEEGHLSVVKELVKNGGNLFLSNNKGDKPIDKAVDNGNRELIEYVTSYDALKIAFGEDINAALDKNGFTALYYAAKYSNMFSLEKLISNGADINFNDNYYELTPLHVGCENGHLSVVKALMKSGSNLFLEDNEGKTPFEGAICSEDRELIEYVTSYDVLKTGFGEDVNAALNKNGEIALHYVSMVKNMSSLERLLCEGANVNIPNNYGQTPLHMGCENGHLAVVEELVKNGGNIFFKNNQGETPIDKAVENGNRELIEYVTSYDVLKIGFGDDINADLDENGRSALHYAAQGKNMSTLERLISEGVNIYITDNEGNTALHMVTKEKSFDARIASLLIKSGLNIDAQNCDKPTPLHLAAYWGTIECVELLLRNGANANIVESKQRTALSVAREEGRDEIFLILWNNTEEELRNERDVLHKYVLTEGENVEVRRKTFVDYPEELSHLVGRMSEAGLYYCGVKDRVICFSCKCLLGEWETSDDPWVKHAEHLGAPNCQFLTEEKGKEFIESCHNSRQW